VARKPPSGFPFLTVRRDTGKYAYWRVLDPAIAVHVNGDVRRSRAVSGHRVTGKEIVKLSLRTATTRRRAIDGRSFGRAPVEPRARRARSDGGGPSDREAR
jgi:hypothetical protein